MAHASAYQHCREFLDKYATHPGRVLDVGGDGGEYAMMCRNRSHRYFTADLTQAADFDITTNPYNWPIKDNWIDYVISSSTFEHIEFPWLTFKEMCRVCKSGGYVYINAPSKGPAHWDRDCWRFYRDSMKAFSKLGDVRLIESYTDELSEWGDTVGIFKKI